MKNSRFVQNLKRQAEENPMMAVMIAVAVASVLLKLVNAATERNNSETWRREVERRRNKST